MHAVPRNEAPGWLLRKQAEGYELDLKLWAGLWMLGASLLVLTGRVDPLLAGLIAGVLALLHFGAFPPDRVEALLDHQR